VITGRAARRKTDFFKAVDRRMRLSGIFATASLDYNSVSRSPMRFRLAARNVWNR
jgi:hypothetical protein